MIYPDLFEFAYVPNWYDHLKTLAEMAMPESWQFARPLSPPKNADTPILEKYVNTVFRKQVIDFTNVHPESDPEYADKIFYIRNEKACFHTGLYTRNYKSSYLMEYSCLKTLAGKHKTTISQTVANNSDGKGRWGIEYITKDGLKRCYFANYTECGSKNDANDKLTNALVIYTQSVNSLEGRLKAKVCELCGTTESDHYELHHVNKLKNLKGKQPWEKAMLAKRRKTLVVCRQCHHDIHNGRV